MRTPYKVPKGYMNRPQAAQYLGLSVWKFLQFVKEKGIPVKYKKGVHTYSITDIEALARDIAYAKEL